MMMPTSFGSPGLLLKGHQQGGQHQLHAVGTQVPHYGFGAVVSCLEGSHKQRVSEVQQMFYCRKLGRRES